MEEEIKALKKRRNVLNLRISDYVHKNKNAYEFVVEHVELTAQLQAKGRNVKSVADYLLLENWEEGGKFYHLRSQGPVKEPTTKPVRRTRVESQPTTKPIKTMVPREEKDPPQTNTSQSDIYTLCLGWVASDKDEPIQIKKVKGYLGELGLPLLDQNINETQSGFVEHVLKYEFSGSADAFRLLKICTQFVLDSFAQSDFDKFNIAVWGKKLRK